MVQPLMEDTKKRVMSLQEIKKGGLWGERWNWRHYICCKMKMIPGGEEDIQVCCILN
jgi:hypothetical protein